MVVALLVVGDPVSYYTRRSTSTRQRGGLGYGDGPGTATTSDYLSGLRSYRFRRQVTLPFPYGDYLPVSPLKYILDNKKSESPHIGSLDLDHGLGVATPVHRVLLRLERFFRKWSKNTALKMIRK